MKLDAKFYGEIRKNNDRAFVAVLPWRQMRTGQSFRRTTKGAGKVEQHLVPVGPTDQGEVR